MNEVLIKLITHYESLHDGDLHKIGLQPKMDPVGIWTEGWGHAIVDSNGKFVKGASNEVLANKLSTIHTVDDANKQLAIDIAPRLRIIQQEITIDLNDNQIAALASFIYNTGGSATLFKLINKKSKDLHGWWCTHYITGQGKRLKGLVYRRHSEADLFCKGFLKFYNK